MEDFEKKLGALDDLDLSDLDDLICDDESVEDIDRNNSDEKPGAPEKKRVFAQDALGGIATDVDIVFCIDVTGSMAPIINTVKELTLSFYDDLITHMKEKASRPVRKLRVKVIAFRDYYCDGDQAMAESAFFTLPEQREAFRSYVSALQAKGGGDEPENALEAMALAMRTDWVKVTDSNTQKARNVIVIFTDASAHKLEKSLEGKPDNYPSDMLNTYKDIYQAWESQGSYQYSMDKKARRLVIFAPQDVYPWSNMVEEFAAAAFVPIDSNQGGIELGKSTIIATIAGSLK